MSILFGHVCLMTALIGLLMMTHSRLKFTLGLMFFWGPVFGVLTGLAQLLLIK